MKIKNKKIFEKVFVIGLITGALGAIAYYLSAGI